MDKKNRCEHSMDNWHTIQEKDGSVTEIICNGCGKTLLEPPKVSYEAGCKLLIHLAKQQVLDEVIEKIESMIVEEGLDTENKGKCNPRCHDSGFNSATIGILAILKNKEEK